MTAQMMPEVVPNETDIRLHVEHLFGGYLDGHHDGKIELAWTKTEPDESGRYKLSYADFFGTDQIDDLVAKAAQLSAQPMCNVYIGAALRKPEVPPMGRAGDEDYDASLAFWCDLDSADAVQQAIGNYADAKPTMLVVTGSHPHPRIQAWWRLAEAVEDPDRLRNALSGIAYKMGGDPTVTNPSRVMRLAGSIAWPHKTGRIPELTKIVPLREPGLSEYYPDHLEQVFPPVYSLSAAREKRHGADGGDGTIVRGTNALGLSIGKVEDGRDTYMLRLICAHLLEYVGTNGAEPTPEELYAEAWPVYRAKADLSRPGHGEASFKQKCEYAVRRFARGEIRGMRSIEEAVASWQRKSAARSAFIRPATSSPPILDWSSPTQTNDATERFIFETVSDLRKLPPAKWLVEGWIPESTTGIIYGKWAAGKSFIAFDLSLHLGYAMGDWHGVPMPEGGADVLVIAREGHQGFVQRIDAFKAKHGIVDDTDRVHFMRAAVSFMNDDDFKALCMAIEAQKRNYRLVVIDTVARVLPGVDMNTQETVTTFMERCSLISQITGAAAIGVHHQNKSGGMMGSTYFEANADFVYEVTRLGEAEDPLRAGGITCTKMKDGPDRWSRSVRYEQISTSLKDTSLVVASIGEGKANQDDWLPSRDTCRRMLEAIDEAWQQGRPLNHTPQAKSGGKYAQRVLSKAFSIRADVVDRLIIDWLDNDILSFEVIDKKTKMKGLRVVGRLD